MIPEIGHFALIVALLIATALTVFPIVGAQRGIPSWMAMARPAAQGLFVFVTLAMVCLAYSFAVNDFSVLNVASNSNSMLPLHYRLAAVWGSHEGSVLLWVFMLTLWMVAVSLFSRHLPREMVARILGVMGFISVGFLLFMLLTSNPFDRLLPAALDGRDLNPLLQDPGMIFHPPMLYMGYVGFSVAFAFAIAALLGGNLDAAWARWSRPWTTVAWVFLTLGIALGSWWAYYELGWGGWWFWDPVENASLMPWLAATALLHSVAVLATRDALRAWTIMLALIAFAMAMAGTFLVRSGILTSVHAFAVDPERGAFILGLLILYIGGALTLFGLRIGVVREGKTFALLSREGAIVGNNIFLSVILAIVLVGTLWPLAAEAMGDKISVGPPYFNQTTVPIGLLLMLLLIVGPVLRWRGDTLSRHRILVAPAMLFLLVAAWLFVIQPKAGLWPILSLALAAATALAALLPLFGRNVLRTPLPIWGMAIAHLGFAVSVAGMAAESGWKVEKLVALRVGESAAVSGWNVKLADVRPVVGDNWVALEGQMQVRRGDDATTMLPQSRQFSSPKQQTTEAALLTRWDGQLYAVIAAPSEGDASDRWQVRLWWKPFVTLIWYGGLLIAIGGAIALLGRVKLALGKRRRRRGNPWSDA